MNKNIRIEKEQSKLKVVPIDDYHIDRAYNTLIENRKNIKNILVILETKDNMGHIITNMADQDALYYFERWKTVKIHKR